MKTLLKSLLVLAVGYILYSTYKARNFNAPIDLESTKIENLSPLEAAQQETTKLQQLLKYNNIQSSQFDLHLRAYKLEQVLELWCKNRTSSKFQLVKTIPFCASSGKLGPKRAQGDLQIPEGFYHIDRFNPKSRFHLSLGINYPNQVDKFLGGKHPGNDIFLHGGCETIGCIPIRNEGIQEVYRLAEMAKAAGQEKIGVAIFPFKMTDKRLDSQIENFPAHSIFWKNLKIESEHFKRTGKRLKFTCARGEYIFNVTE